MIMCPKSFEMKHQCALVSARGQRGELLSICALQDRSAFFSCLLEIHFLPEQSAYIPGFLSSLSHHLRNLRSLFGVNTSSRLSYQFFFFPIIYIERELFSNPGPREQRLALLASAPPVRLLSYQFLEAK